MNPYSVRARFLCEDGARNDAQYMSLLGDTLRTQRTANFPDSAMSDASRARGDGSSFSGIGRLDPTASSHRAWTSVIASASLRALPKQ